MNPVSNGVEATNKITHWDSTAKGYIDVAYPDMVKAYNEKMGGVDTNDMLISLYRLISISKNVGMSKSSPTASPSVILTAGYSTADTWTNSRFCPKINSR